MSRDVWIEAVIATDTSYNAVHIISNRGIEIGFKYINKNAAFPYKDISDEYITPEQAIADVIEGLESHRLGIRSARTIPCIEAKFLDTFICIIFGKHSAHSINLLFDVFGGRWYKGNPEEEHIDWARYMQLLLNLCQDFPIIEIKTIDSHYNEI